MWWKITLTIKGYTKLSLVYQHIRLFLLFKTTIVTIKLTTDDKYILTVLNKMNNISYFSISNSLVRSIINVLFKLRCTNATIFFFKKWLFFFFYWPCPIRDSAAARVEWVHSTSKNLKSYPLTLNSSSKIQG